MPRKSLLCEKKLKEAGVHGSLTNIEEFSLTLIPFDSDLLSMEIENSFRVSSYIFGSKIHSQKSIYMYLLRATGRQMKIKDPKLTSMYQIF